MTDNQCSSSSRLVGRLIYERGFNFKQTLHLRVFTSIYVGVSVWRHNSFIVYLKCGTFAFYVIFIKWKVHVINDLNVSFIPVIARFTLE